MAERQVDSSTENGRTIETYIVFDDPDIEQEYIDLDAKLYSEIQDLDFNNFLEVNNKYHDLKKVSQEYDIEILSIMEDLKEKGEKIKNGSPEHKRILECQKERDKYKVFSDIIGQRYSELSGIPLDEFKRHNVSELMDQEFSQLISKTIDNLRSAYDKKFQEQQGTIDDLEQQLAYEKNNKTIVNHGLDKSKVAAITITSLLVGFIGGGIATYKLKPDAAVETRYLGTVINPEAGHISALLADYKSLLNSERQMHSKTKGKLTAANQKVTSLGQTIESLQAKSESLESQVSLLTNQSRRNEIVKKTTLYTLFTSEYTNTLSIKNTAIFDSGSTEVRTEHLPSILNELVSFERSSESEIIIYKGHSDTDSINPYSPLADKYVNNYDLSLDRALNFHAAIFSLAEDRFGTKNPFKGKIFAFKGYGFDQPAKDANLNYDEDGSRRVEVCVPSNIYMNNMKKLDADREDLLFKLVKDGYTIMRDGVDLTSRYTLHDIENATE